MKIGVISLGCAKNLVDTEYLLGLLKESKQELVTDPAEADAVIINTCGFIEGAKQEAINTILEAADWKQKNVQKLVVIGCLVQRYQEELSKEIPEVDRFISIREYGQLGSILTSVLGVPIANDYGKARTLSGKPWMAYLRIADGCDNHCSYCAIPNIRGPLHSYPMEDLVAEAKRLQESGVQELNLVAQDSSRYGYDLDGKLHLSALLKELDQLNFQWIRILYLYPDEIPDDLIDTIRNSKHILPYFDIPVQHGSDRILRAMHRRGNRALIEERAEKIRQELPQAVLRTTLITGFPGETEADHQENLSLVRKVKWDALGCFTYSKEENTPAYDLEDDVEPFVKEQRKAEIMQIQNKIATENMQKYVGQTMDVLVEGTDPITQLAIGRAWVFAPDDVDGSVRIHSKRDLKEGAFVKVHIEKASQQNLIGTAVED